MDQDIENGLKLMKQAADLGNAEACYSMGFFHGKGIHFEETDINKAIHYYTLAAEKGNENAMNELGFIYCKGKGVPVDYKKAFNYLTTSFEKGNTKGKKNKKIKK